MEKYIIAGLKTEYQVRGELLRERSEPYKADFSDDETQIRAIVSDEYINRRMEKIPYLNADEHEYMWTCDAFYNEKAL